MELMNTSPDSGLPIETLRYTVELSFFVIIKQIKRIHRLTLTMMYVAVAS